MNNEIWLKNDHSIIDQKILEVLGQIGHEQINTDLFAEIESGLKRHIFFEETILFPSLDDGDVRIHQMMEGLKMEHAALWKLMNIVDKEIADEIFIKIKKSVSEMLMILRVHNEIEEKNVYTLIKSNSEIDKFDIEALELPSGWICEKLRNRKNTK